MTFVKDLFRLVERGPEDMHDYQNEAVEFLWERPFSALFIDLGLGKTVISLTVIARIVSQLFEQDADEGHPVLVIAPLKVATQTWPNEIPLWAHTAGLSYVVIRAEGDEFKDEIKAAGQRRVDAVKDFYADMPKEARTAFMNGERAAAETDQKYVIMGRLARKRACIHIINREAVYWLASVFRDAWPYRTVIIDESSNFKDYSTERFRALKAVRKHITRLHLLTATPAPETYIDLFAQIFLLDGGERFSRSITWFKEKWFTEDKYTRKWKPRPGAQDEITKLISPICLVMKAEDYLDLEKPTLRARLLKMQPSQIEMYRKMETDFVMELPGGVEILAENGADQAQKLLQLCSGTVYETKTVPHPKIKGEFKKVKVTHHVHDLKIEDLENLIEELQGKPILVAYWFQSSLDRLKKVFPQGKVMDKEGKLVKEWNTGKLPICFIHPASGAHGLNMQKGGHHLYLFDLFYSLELFLQLIGRLARQGQVNPVSVHLPQVIGTVDEVVVAAQMEKRNAQDDLFRRLKLLRKRAELGVADAEDVDFREDYNDDVFADELEL